MAAWETGFEQIGQREIDRDVRPWRVIDTYRAWLRYEGQVYQERVIMEYDWAGPDDAPIAGESAPATNKEDLYGAIRDALSNLHDKATTFATPGEEFPPWDAEDPPPYKPSPEPADGQYHSEGDCWCGETHPAGVCPGCGEVLDAFELHYHGH